MGPDALLVVPPLADSRSPALGVHVLQACARAEGFDVRVHYANVAYAAAVGEERYLQALESAPVNLLLGEHLFSAAAFGFPSLRERGFPVDVFDLEEATHAWVRQTAERVRRLAPKVVGLSTTFEQTAASCALLREIRRAMPEVTLILGGANCEGDMAEGILSLDTGVDYVFAGESEAAFPAFLRGERPAGRVVAGRPCRDLDALPTPDFTEFFEQRQGLAEPPGGLRLSYESSRGCWWGQKHHCTFCGLNGGGMAFRAKTADRVLRDLETMLQRYPARKILMADNIMPRQYFKTLLPRLRTEARILYEQKANLTLAEVVALKEAGVTELQPGIEALSTALLKRMDKGTTARQNLNLLRYARSAGVSLVWNLLYAFPGDRLEDYEGTLAILPLLHHLQPPGGPFPLNVDRFSPYFERPEDFAIHEVRPIPSYASSFPAHADLRRLAYHFEATYASESAEESPVMREFTHRVGCWRERWSGSERPPVLEVRECRDSSLTGLLLLQDTRGLPDTMPLEPITADQARACLVGGRAGPQSERGWAVQRRVAVEYEGSWIPLATALPRLLARFEQDYAGGNQP